MPYLRSNSTLWSFSCYLELDFEKVEWVHTEHRDDSGAEARKCMVLYICQIQQAIFTKVRTIA
jgi:hypothetical protein